MAKFEGDKNLSLKPSQSKVRSLPSNRSFSFDSFFFIFYVQIMPHLEIKYFANIKLDTKCLFDQIESAINKLDSSAGGCKSRAYSDKSYKHSHVMIDVWLLLKQHRNQAFTQSLFKEIVDCVKRQIANHCYVSVQLHYRNVNYITME
jgi:5-carboxymethyl-2-hydroxymuconate isomerase